MEDVVIENDLRPKQRKILKEEQFEDPEQVLSILSLIEKTKNNLSSNKSTNKNQSDNDKEEGQLITVPQLSKKHKESDDNDSEYSDDPASNEDDEEDSYYFLKPLVLDKSVDNMVGDNRLLNTKITALDTDQYRADFLKASNLERSTTKPQTPSPKDLTQSASYTMLSSGKTHIKLASDSAPRFKQQHQQDLKNSPSLPTILDITDNYNSNPTTLTHNNNCHKVAPRIYHTSPTVMKAQTSFLKGTSPSSSNSNTSSKQPPLIISNGRANALNFSRSFSSVHVKNEQKPLKTSSEKSKSLTGNSHLYKKEEITTIISKMIEKINEATTNPPKTVPRCDTRSDYLHSLVEMVRSLTALIKEGTSESSLTDPEQLLRFLANFTVTVKDFIAFLVVNRVMAMERTKVDVKKDIIAFSELARKVLEGGQAVLKKDPSSSNTIEDSYIKLLSNVHISLVDFLQVLKSNVNL